MKTQEYCRLTQEEVKQAIAYWLAEFTDLPIATDVNLVTQYGTVTAKCFFDDLTEVSDEH